MKLLIDERDLRCTILEGIRNTNALLDPEQFAKAIADAVIVCGDYVAQPTATDDQLTEPERLVYAAALAFNTPERSPEFAYNAAWLTIMFMREDYNALRDDRSKGRERAMFEAFKKGAAV